MLDRLIALHDDWGQPAEAAEYRARPDRVGSAGGLRVDPSSTFPGPFTLLDGGVSRFFSL
jgi:hypothetical protein